MLQIVSPVLIFSGIYAAIGAYFLLLCFRIPSLRSPHMLWFIGTCFVAAVYNTTWVGIYTSSSRDDWYFWIRAAHVVIPLLALTITGFLKRYVKDAQKWIITCFYIIFALFFLATLFGGKYVYTVYDSFDGSIGIFNASIPRAKVEAGIIVIALYAFLLFAFLYCFIHVTIWGTKGEKKEAIPVLAGVAALFVMVASDIAVYYKLISFIFTSQFGFFFVMLSMCYATINRIASQWTDQSSPPAIEHSDDRSKTTISDELFKNVDTESIKNRLLELMHEEKIYADENLSLDDTAKYLSLPPHKFSRFMNLIMDSDFRNFINKFRVEEAKRLLKNEPDLSIKEICYEVGFKSASTFHDSFKKFTGTSPGKFRKQVTA